MTKTENSTDAPRSEQARRWTLAEAAQRNAQAQNDMASKARLKAQTEASAKERPENQRNWRIIALRPDVAPFVAAEQAAQRAERAAERRLIATPASDWRAWALKANVVREFQDHLLNPLEPVDRKHVSAKPKKWPGSLIYAELHHFALALHCGLGSSELAQGFVSRLLRMCSQIGVTPDPRSDEFVPFGLAMLLDDAARLAGEAA